MKLLLCLCRIDGDLHQNVLAGFPDILFKYCWKTGVIR